MGNRLNRIAVYCGSSPGCDPAFAAAARELGRTLAERKIGLVYGGGKVGMMGVLADAALDAGGEVIGVIPHALVEAELAHPQASEMVTVATMHERKARFTELSDGFICLPGGIGTLDEMFEAWTWNALGYHDKPLCLLNAAGYWDRLTGFLDHATESGFMSTNRRAQLLLADTADEAIGHIERAAAEPQRGMIW